MAEPAADAPAHAEAAGEAAPKKRARKTNDKATLPRWWKDPKDVGLFLHPPSGPAGLAGAGVLKDGTEIEIRQEIDA
ncbi:MAG: hypothetical protein WBY44_19970 [Bryobacteraceae bacterium]